MTGQIRRLASGDEAGSIRAEGGLHVSFDHSAVVAYDRDHLAVGQTVTFDLDDGVRPFAVNILQMDAAGASRSQQQRAEMDRLRYTGFEHSEGRRIFRFKQMVPGEERKVFLVTADLRLFAKHHVGLQEGPALCFRLLANPADPSQAPRNRTCALTDRDMLAHIERRPSPPRRKPFKRSAVSSTGNNRDD